MKKESSLIIGKILKPFGISGSLKVLCLSDFPDRFGNLKEVFLFDEKKDSFIENFKSNSFTFEIEDVEILQNFIKLKFYGYDAVNESERLRNYLIAIDENEKFPLPENKFYFYDLFGLPVFENGSQIGIVEKVDNYGGDDLIFVKNSNGKSFYIPLRKEFILKLDLKDKRIDVQLLEGMI